MSYPISMAKAPAPPDASGTSRPSGYLHGYAEQEQQRLVRQARFLENQIFESFDLSACRHLLEVGCGTRAECELLLRRFPLLRVTAIDISAQQLAKAADHVAQFPELMKRCELLQADASDLSQFATAKFDSAFLCWVLEHVPNPAQVLAQIRNVLAPGGRICISEVFNHTLYLDPPIVSLEEYWTAYNQLQMDLGGDPNAGIKLGRRLHEAGFENIQVWPKTLFFDGRDAAGRARMMDYFLELMLTAREQLIERGLLRSQDVANLIADWTAARDRDEAIFFYQFMQATGRVQKHE